jgi:hypothetical protein
MIAASILRAMVAAGASAEIIIAAVEADQEIIAEKIVARRLKDRERQRLHRAKKRNENNDPSHVSRVTPRDPLSPSPPPSSFPPITPLLTTTPSPPNPHGSLRSLVRFPPGAFEIFWQSYPRKAGKGAAKAAFERIQRREDAPEFPDLLDAVRRIKTDGDLKFVPHPSTWLNQARWQDEHPSGPDGDGNDRRKFSAALAAGRLAEAADRGEFTFGPKPTLPGFVSAGGKADPKLLSQQRDD